MMQLKKKKNMAIIGKSISAAMWAILASRGKSTTECYVCIKNFD
jgi:hypothetical protein